MESRTIVMAPSAKGAAQEAPFSAIWYSAESGPLGRASGDTSSNFETTALDRWENEGGVVIQPDADSNAAWRTKKDIKFG